MERAEREFCDCSQRVCSARLFASEIILKITEDHFINLVEIWSKATKHGPLSLKLQKGAFWQLWQRMHFYLHDVLCLNGLSHLPAGVSNSISPRATMKNDNHIQTQTHLDLIHLHVTHSRNQIKQLTEKVKPWHSWAAGLMFALNQGCQTSCPLWP